MSYFKKYSSLLKAKNLLYIKQLLYLLAQLLKCFKKFQEARLLLLSDFLVETELLNLNLFKIIRYIEKSKISHKLNGFYKAKKDAANNEITEKKKPGLSAFLNR